MVGYLNKHSIYPYRSDSIYQPTTIPRQNDGEKNSYSRMPEKIGIKQMLHIKDITRTKVYTI